MRLSNSVLHDIGLFCVAKAGEIDPYRLAVKIGHELRIHSIDIETMLVSVAVYKHYGWREKDLKEAEENLKNVGLFEKLVKFVEVDE